MISMHLGTAVFLIFVTLMWAFGSVYSSVYSQGKKFKNKKLRTIVYSDLATFPDGSKAYTTATINKKKYYWDNVNGYSGYFDSTKRNYFYQDQFGDVTFFKLDSAGAAVHRLDGPAHFTSDGIFAFYVNGVYVEPHVFGSIVSELK